MIRTPPTLGAVQPNPDGTVTYVATSAGTDTFKYTVPHSVGSSNVAKVTVTAAPTTGATAINATTGAISYTPTGTTSGTDTFTYTVANTNAVVSNPASVTVTITAAVVETVAVKPPVKCTRPNGWDMTGSSSITTGTSSLTLYNTARVPAVPSAANVNGTATISAGKWQYRANGALPCKSPISIKTAGGAKQENIAVQIK